MKLKKNVSLGVKRKTDSAFLREAIPSVAFASIAIVRFVAGNPCMDQEDINSHARRKTWEHLNTLDNTLTTKKELLIVVWNVHYPTSTWFHMMIIFASIILLLNFRPNKTWNLKFTLLYSPFIWVLAINQKFLLGLLIRRACYSTICAGFLRTKQMSEGIKRIYIPKILRSSGVVYGKFAPCPIYNMSLAFW